MQVRLAPIPQGNSFLYFILAAVGIFTLMVGAWVRLRRPGDQSSLHLFWLTVAFFGVFTFSFSGRFDRLDWVFYWADMVALLALAPMLLHFTLVFPERANGWARTPLGARLLPLLYLPALVMGSVRVMAVARLDGNSGLLNVVAALDRLRAALPRRLPARRAGGARARPGARAVGHGAAPAAVDCLGHGCSAARRSPSATPCRSRSA